MDIGYNAYGSVNENLHIIGSGSGISDGFYFISDVIGVLLPLFVFAVGIFYVIYLIITAVRHGLDEVLVDLQKRGNQIFGGIARLWKWIISRKIRHIFQTGWHNLIFWILVLGVVSLLSSISAGTSRLLKVDRIPEGMVGVDLQNNRTIQPGYHMYSPLTSSYFLSPTNTFDFEIAEATANTVEELTVAIDRRVGFMFQEGERLEFYNQYGAKDIRAISSDIVMPLLLESIKTVVYRYSFKDLSAKSDEIKQAAFDLASQKIAEKGIGLQYLNIIDIRLPESYLKSQEDLLKAENESKLAEAALETQRKQAEKDLLKAENQKSIKIIEAEGIAEYNSIISKQNLTNQGLEMKKLELEEKKIEKWDGKLPGNVEGGFEF